MKPGDSWALIGTKGSGKTTGLKYLDAAYTQLFPAMRHYVLDSKHDGDFDDWPGRVVSNYAPGLPAPNERYQVWAPIRIIPDEVEAWLEMILGDPPALLSIDELVHLVYKRNMYSDMYNIIQKTGRSLPIATITLTQELSRIPPNAYKQSTHVLGFYIREAAEYDRRILNLLLGAKVDNPHHPFGLYYQHERGRGEPEYHASIQKFLGGK